jgi:hypothetical protein
VGYGIQATTCKGVGNAPKFEEKLQNLYIINIPRRIMDGTTAAWIGEQVWKLIDEFDDGGSEEGFVQNVIQLWMMNVER